MTLASTPGPPSPPGPPATPPRWAAWQSVSLGCCAVLVVSTGFAVVPRSPIGGWGSVVALLVLMTAIVGLATTGRATGALIDRRNRFSLARLQLLLWTILLGSSVFVAGMANVATGEANPLQVNVPETLWALMGFGVASAVGAPLLQQGKTRRPADPAERDRAFRALAARSGTADRIDGLATLGQLVVNRGPADAESADLLTGDEVGDAAFVNLGKLQFAFVTLLALALYAAALVGVLQQPAPIRALPALDNGLVTLLGISHAGFLAHTAAPQSLSPA